MEAKWKKDFAVDRKIIKPFVKWAGGKSQLQKYVYSNFYMGIRQNICYNEWSIQRIIVESSAFLASNFEARHKYGYLCE